MWSDEVLEMMTASAHVSGETVAAFPAVGSILRLTRRGVSPSSAYLMVPEVMISSFPVALYVLCNNNI